MAIKKVSSILWRRVNQATINTLIGQSRGQYDIRLTSSVDLTSFFEGIEPHDMTDLGGFTMDVPIEPYEGQDPVPEEILNVRFMGEQASRSRDWYIRAQRPNSAYLLWRPGRAFDANAALDSVNPPYIYIIKDIDNKYHARWISGENLSLLPQEVQGLFQSMDVGTHTFPHGGSKNQRAIEIYNKLQEQFNVIIYGPPGTGKTYLMQEVRRLFESPQLFINTLEEVSALSALTNSSVQSGWVTFHQSFSYEEFVIGLKTDPSSHQLLSLKPVPGILLELAEFARQGNNSSLLLVDEINRGNISRIFGEFITLLEAKKRLDKLGNKTDQTVAVRLPI